MIPPEVLGALATVPDLAIRQDEPLGRHNLLRVGGPVGLWLVAETEAAAVAAQKICRDGGVKVRTLTGEHWLARDEGLEGACLVLGHFARRIEPRDGGLRVGAQVPSARLALRAASLGLTGLEALAGHPGTVAEALAQGLFGDAVTGVRALRGSRAANLTPEKWTPTQPPIRVDLALKLALPTTVRAASRTRAAASPERPGRMMADPPHQTAAALIDDAGLSGVRLRSVRIGQHEPNSLVNLGGATARDVALVVAMLRDRVKLRTGVELAVHPEHLGRAQRA